MNCVRACCDEAAGACWNRPRKASSDGGLRTAACAGRASAALAEVDAMNAAPSTNTRAVPRRLRRVLLSAFLIDLFFIADSEGVNSRCRTSCQDRLLPSTRANAAYACAAGTGGE